VSTHERESLNGRVLQFLGPSTGGIRAHVAELARRLPDHGWDATVAGSAHVMDGVGRQDATVDVPPVWNVPAYRPARRRLSSLLSGVDVLHVHGLKAAMVAVGADQRPPMVLTVHNLVGGTRRGPSAKVLRRAETYVVERCDHLIVISDEIDERFADVLPPERRTFILPVAPARSVQRSAPEVRASYGIAADAPLVTIVARHHPQKNLPMFLDAMRLVRDRLPEVRGLMVGDGPERGALEAHRHALGLDDTVVVAGMRPNPVDEMHAADVVALTSDWEGSPLVVAECLAVGRPLVTTAVGTVRRHLVDGENARIVAIGDPRAMADALVELLVDRSLADAIGAAGQRVAAAVFDADRLTAAVAAVYRDIPRRTSR